MTAIEFWRRKIQQPRGVLIDEAAALFRGRPVLAGDLDRRLGARRHALDRRQSFARLRRHDRRHGRFENAGLLGGDLAQRIAEMLGVVERHRRNDGRQRVIDHIGRVEPSAHSDLEQQHVRAMACKEEKRGRRRDLEHGDGRAGIDALAFAERIGELLVGNEAPLSLGEVKRGLATVRLSGRLQVLPGRPAIVLDVAHNPHAARALADGLLDMGFFETTTAVFGMLADKDIDAVVEAMRERVDRWFVAAPQAERAASAARLMQPLESRGLAARAFVSIAQALEAARREAGANDRIVAFGSFYTVAEALRTVR